MVVWSKLQPIITGHFLNKCLWLGEKTIRPNTNLGEIRQEIFLLFHHSIIESEETKERQRLIRIDRYEGARASFTFPQILDDQEEPDFHISFPI